jgi:hypothetical protein
MKKNILDSSDYINNLPFEYFETYSFQRGEMQTVFQEKVISEINRLNEELKIPKIGHLKRQSELGYWEKYKSNTQYLFNEKKELHPTAIKKTTIYRDEDKIKELIDILNSKYKNEYAMPCGPVFRDAIVFYNTQKEVVSVLNICFTCQMIRANTGDLINANNAVYAGLNRFLSNFGHDIKNDSFV